MSSLRRIVLVRHGETDGESSIRFHGTTDVGLAPEGREQMKAVARQLRFESFDGLFASPLRRAWAAAWIVGGGGEISLMPQFREVDFGRWEGLTREEIEARDPVLAKDWQDGAEGFEYPGGESRSGFRARVESGLDAVLASGLSSALVVAHKGVIRTIAEKLTGEALDREAPPLGGVLVLTRDGDGSWFAGQRGSNPPALAEQA
jgi:broad specificity phosphatase PhoE